ncbi:MAG: hypothetical protein HY926_06025 [Elusimicrobia bacterium]|nr:hypothetical protein [Elusimicrobiota bacterium]
MPGPPTPLIYLANLVHVRDGRPMNNSVPIAAAYLASYLDRHLGRGCKVEIFSLPGELEAALRSQPPDLLAASGYVWNSRLNYLFLEQFKKAYPGRITVMGGPQYPGAKPLQERFLREFEAVDFFVFREGEAVFLELVRRCLDQGFDRGRIRRSPLKGCHWLEGGALAGGEAAPRLTDLAELPSPYLDGRLDRFLEAGFVPVVQGNRGCPFSCAYCHCGAEYYNRVVRFPADRTLAEIDHIAAHVSAKSLHIADSNFGMFLEDQGVARRLAETRERTGWPVMVNAATAKAHKERVAECISLLGPAVEFSASLQSAHPPTLKAIRRVNLALEDYHEIRGRLQSQRVPSICELIIPLPEETAASHLRGVERALDSGIDQVCPYTCMLLKDTALGEGSAFDRFGQLRRFRVIPRAFGEYLGRRVVETEEVCAATASMSFEEYVDLRGFHFVVSNYHNLGALQEVVLLLRGSGASVYSWLRRVQEELARDSGPAGETYRLFLKETRDELWEREEDLRKHCLQEEGFQALLQGRAGTNLLLKNQALALERLAALADVGAAAARGLLSSAQLPALEEAVRFCVALRGGVFSREQAELTAGFSFDILGWRRGGASADWTAFPGPCRLRFSVTAEQKRMLDDYYAQYGETADARGKILTRLSAQMLYRRCEPV